MSLKFIMDTSQFDKEFKRYAEKSTMENLKKGLYAMGNAVINDSNKVIPKTPHKMGELIRSAKVEVDPGGQSVEFGYTVPYAAKLHEAPENWNWTLAGSGPKYLLTKMLQNGEKYMQLITNFLKNRL